MKRITCSYFLLLFLCTAITLSACHKDNKTVFTATVLENDSSFIVEPQQSSNEYNSLDKIAVHANNAAVYNSDNKKISLSDITVGQTVQITYNGLIAESYPAQITASKIKVIE